MGSLGRGRPRIRVQSWVAPVEESSVKIDDQDRSLSFSDGALMEVE